MIQNPKAEKPFVSISDCCTLTGLSKFYLRKGCKDGSIPHIEVGNKYLINLPMLMQRLDAESEGVRNAQ